MENISIKGIVIAVIVTPEVSQFFGSMNIREC